MRASWLGALALVGMLGGCAALREAQVRGTGDLGVVIERAAGRVQIVETSTRTRLATVEGLGDLSHASVVFSRDARYAYVFGRDGGLSKVDLLLERLEKRIIQGGNSIGGAISQDGRILGVSNYEPGGVRFFDARTLEPLCEIPAVVDGRASKTLGLIDLPDDRFAFCLYEAGEIWVADLADPHHPVVTRHRDIGHQPYDAFVTPDAHHYVAGLFGEDGLAQLDLWDASASVRRILSSYGKGQTKLPVYKMPHLEGWALTGQEALIPAVGAHEVLVVNTTTWQEAGRIPVHGQPVFVVARPDARQVWVNFAVPDNDTVQVIDVPSRRVIKTLHPGKGVLHLEFTPRGEQLWLSVRDENRLEIYDTRRLEKIGELRADAPSGIFFTVRAGRLGM